MIINPYSSISNTKWQRFQDCVTSPFFLSLILISGVIVSAVYTSQFSLENRLIVLIPSPIFTMKFITHNRKFILYECSLAKSIFLNTFAPSSNPWWNEITPNIILGALPLENRGHPAELTKNLGVTHFVSLVEPFEHQRSIFSSPIQYNKQSNNVKCIATQDYGASSIDDLNKGADWMHKAIQSNGKVYVHCKAGKGRSALLVACYLLKHSLIDQNGPVQNEPSKRVATVLEILKKNRNIVHLNKKQRGALLDFCISLNK